MTERKKFKIENGALIEVILEPENPLAKFTDEELIAEVIKKRGLR